MGRNSEGPPIITIPRPTEMPLPSIGTEKVIGPTPQEAEEANAGMIKSNPIVKFIGKHPSITAGIGLTTIAGVGGAVAVGLSVQLNNRTEVHQSIPEVPSAVNIHNVDRSEGPFTFDNKAGQGIIESNNLAKLPQIEIDTQFPTAFGKLDDGKNTLQLQFPLDISSSSNPDASLEYTKSFSGTSYSERMRYPNTEIHDTFTFQDVPGGSIIRSPVDGFIRSATDVTQLIPPNGSDSQGALIDFVAPDGKHYRIAIYGSTTDSRSGITNHVFKTFIEMPIAQPTDNKKIIGTFGVPIKKGQPILTLILAKNNRPIEEFGFRIAVAREGEIGQPPNRENPSIPTNMELFITPDGKLITSK